MGFLVVLIFFSSDFNFYCGVGEMLREDELDFFFFCWSGSLVNEKLEIQKPRE